MVAILGGCFIAIACGSTAVIDQFVARSNEHYGTVLVTRATITLATAIPLALCISWILGDPLFATTEKTWWWSIASEVCTLAGAALNLWLLRSHSVIVVVIVSGLYPITAAIITHLLGYEKLTIQQGLALCLISIGVVVFFLPRRSL